MPMSFKRCFKLALVLCAFLPAQALMAQDEVCFSPPLRDGCDPLNTVLKAISGAKNTIHIQMYDLTLPEIVNALVEAEQHHVEVRLIGDKGRLQGDTNNKKAADHLAACDVPVGVDRGVHHLMHNKIMIIDHTTVLTGSFNYTSSAKKSNAENLVILHDPALVAEFVKNWEAADARSLPWDSADVPCDGPLPEGSMRGRRHKSESNHP
jgi:phospholipase D